MCPAPLPMAIRSAAELYQVLHVHTKEQALPQQPAAQIHWHPLPTPVCVQPPVKHSAGLMVRRPTITGLGAAMIAFIILNAGGTRQVERATPRRAGSVLRRRNGLSPARKTAAQPHLVRVGGSRGATFSCNSRAPRRLCRCLTSRCMPTQQRRRTRSRCSAKDWLCKRTTAAP